MADTVDIFERISRRAHLVSEPEVTNVAPFDVRNIHPGLPKKVRKLFDDGHFVEATFEACKFVDVTVARHANLKESGQRLMMNAFDKTKANYIKLNGLNDQSEEDEQTGYRFIFAGAVQAIRNPRGHQAGMQDDIDTCLDHLSFVSMLLRRLEQAGFTC